MSDPKDKPVFDEQTLARVLEAAYVLQEHNRALELNLELQSDQLRERQEDAVPQPAAPPAAPEDKSSSSDDDYTLILAQIVETQHQIQVRQLELESALALVAQRLAQITKASGAAVAVVEGKIVRYQAGSGTSAPPQGSKLPMEKALCFTCLRTGQVMRCPDVNPEFLLDAEECHRRGIQSLIAVPVYHDGGVAGALELYFGAVNAFTEQDIHTCQLMAGLVTEALARDAQLTWKKSLEAERATILEALERLKPDLSALADASLQKPATGKEVAPASAVEQIFECRKCGHALVGEEQFCGKCGAPRIIDNEPPSLQSKVASLWQMKHGKNPPKAAEDAPQLQDKPATGEPAGKSDLPAPAIDDQEQRERELARLLANSVPDFSIVHDPEELERLPGIHFNADAKAEEDENPEEQEIRGAVLPKQAEDEDVAAATSTTALQKTNGDSTWTSAAQARDFLEQVAQSHKLSPFQRFWNMRRGDFYLAVAVILMAIVIRWGVWSDHTVGASGSTMNAASQRRPDADLSVFDKLLIRMGLAEAPDKPEPRGNPETQVWVDLHTALYYCPGTDLYGKTPKGKYTSQKDAQLDQFEPAYRKACD